jgi:hypothetical protein
MKGLFVHMFEKRLGKFLTDKRLVEIVSKLNIPLAPPLIALVQVTLRCNSKSSYCPLWKLRDEYIQKAPGCNRT